MDYSGSCQGWQGLYNPLEGNIYLVYKRYILPRHLGDYILPTVPPFTRT